MLTRLEINGFKSFDNFVINFQPFQVFSDPNGVGKTNLFDAAVLLSHPVYCLTRGISMLYCFQIRPEDWSYDKLIEVSSL